MLPLLSRGGILPVVAPRADGTPAANRDGRKADGPAMLQEQPVTAGSSVRGAEGQVVPAGPATRAAPECGHRARLHLMATSLEAPRRGQRVGKNAEDKTARWLLRATGRFYGERGLDSNHPSTCPSNLSAVAQPQHALATATATSPETVHRITNRWGLVATRTPEQTLAALETLVPRERWIDVNRLLMPFGKFICTGALPRCSTCPCRPICPQIGVTRHR